MKTKDSSVECQMTLLERVCGHEGFRDRPYQDSQDVWTIGHGLTWISEAESKHIVENRLWGIGSGLLKEFPWLVSPVVVDVLTEMEYQLGYTGLRNFKKTLAHLKAREYLLAGDEMIRSNWYEQTPYRAEELAQIIRELQPKRP